MTHGRPPRKPRKHRYQADPASIYKLMNKLQPFTATELLQLELPIRISYEAIKTGRFEPLPGQLGTQLREHCLDCARRTSKRLDAPIFAGVKFDDTCKFKLTEEV